MTKVAKEHVALLQYDSAMQGQAQAAAAQGMALRYVGSLDLVKRRCSVELKVMHLALVAAASR